MKLIFTTAIFAILCSPLFSKAQLITYPDQSRTGQYIESARMVIDILKLLKGNKPAAVPKNLQQDNKNTVCNFCFYNSDSLQVIRVTLCEKHGSSLDTSIMVIKSLGRECSLQIRCGVYNCKIENQRNEIISWGDILVNEKQIDVTR